MGREKFPSIIAIELWEFKAMNQCLHQCYILILLGPRDYMHLIEELYTVTNIFSLGDHLKIPTNILEEIKLDCHNIEDRRRALFIWWMDNTPEKNRTWAAIVYALSRSSHMCLAEKIALKFGG